MRTHWDSFVPQQKKDRRHAVTASPQQYGKPTMSPSCEFTLKHMTSKHMMFAAYD